MRNPERPRNLVMDFYLPCVVSGVLLAGLISITEPMPPAEQAAPSALVLAAY